MGARCARGASAGFAMAAMLVCANARAQDTLDTIELPGGGFMRGTVLAYVPGESVVIRLPNGDLRTIPPDLVVAVRRAGEEPMPRAPELFEDFPRPSFADDTSDEFADPEADDPEHVPDRVWVLDDHRGEEVPWDDFDPRAEYLPRGEFHLGVQVRAGLLPGHSEIPWGPFLECGLVLDIRYSRTSPWHMRGVIAFSWQNQTSTSPGATFLFRLLPLTIDLGDWIVVRAGGQIGAHWLQSPGGGALEFHGGANGEIALKLIDGRLELALTGGFQTSRFRRGDDWGAWTDTAITAMAGGHIGYVLW
jgi:hypothetical protein